MSKLLCIKLFLTLGYRLSVLALANHPNIQMELSVFLTIQSPTVCVRQKVRVPGHDLTKRLEIGPDEERCGCIGMVSTLDLLFPNVL